MRVSCIVLLAGCGFQSAAAPGLDATPADATRVDATPVDAAADASSPDASPVTCWKIADTARNFHVSACPAMPADRIDVTMNVSIDTDAGTSNPAGLTCAPLGPGDDAVCALAASSIAIAQGVTLSAHGTRPLALLGHSIDLEGTVDVASHVGGPRGPASNQTGCNPGAAATNSGGGGGGGLSGPGGNGGDEGGSPLMTGGAGGNTTGFTGLRGGCDGGRGGDGTASGGPPGMGGAGGGAVWLAADTGTLMIGSRARINASGAGGVRGPGIPSGLDAGGTGGGSGGMIVLQAQAITLDPMAQIFANGGGGGGGAQVGQSGHDGSDPPGPTAGGAGGTGGGPAAVPPGKGAAGYPDLIRNGGAGDPVNHGGGGGGGGGSGAIRVASSTRISGANVSPMPLALTP